MKTRFKLILFIPSLIIAALVFHSYIFPGNSLFYLLSDLTFSHLCHQIDYKSFYVNGIKLPVCARCTGLYTGILTASIISLFSKKMLIGNFKIFIFSFFLMLLDSSAVSIGIYGYNKIIALISGIIFGYVIFYYILTGLENLFTELNSGKKVE